MPLDSVPWYGIMLRAYPAPRGSDGRVTMGKGNQSSPRELGRKAVYVPPAILTLAAAPAYTKYGSNREPKPSKAL